MRGFRSLAPVLCSLAACVGALRAEENWIHVLGRERVAGDLAPGERDFFVLRAIAGTRLDFYLRWQGAGECALELYGPSGRIDLAGSLRMRPQHVRASGVVLEETGAHYLVAGATNAGRYTLNFRARPPRSQRASAIDPGGGTRVEIPIARGAEATVELMAPRGSPYSPRFLEVLSPQAQSVDFEVIGSNVRSASIRFDAEASGVYVAHFDDAEGDPATVAISIRAKLPPLARRDLDLRFDPAPLQAFPPGDPALEPWRRLHRLAELETTARSFQDSSFDRTGNNDDGLSGVHTVLRIEGQEAVVFDQEGPGVIERIHFAFRSTPGSHLGHFPGAEQYRVRFFFDDEPAPRVDLPVRDLVSGSVAPFLAPTVGDDTVSPGGPYLYTPIPFARRLVVRTTGPAFYLHIGWRRLEAERALASFDPAQTNTAPLDGLLRGQGADPHGATAFAEVARMRLDLSPAATGTAFLHEGPGWIAALEIEPDASARSLVSDLRLEIAFDGAAVPDVDCPLDLFFGCGLGEVPVRALLFELAPSGVYRCWWPMPFASSAVLRLVNRSASTAGLVVRIAYVPVPYGGRFGTFRAQLRVATPPPIEQWLELRDYELYAAEGHGRLVGLSMVVGSEGLLGAPQPRTYLEGDEHVHVDGLRTPSHHGTGTEEIWNWAWYEAEFAQPFTRELHGFSARRIGLISDYTAGYRVMVGDPIPYASAIRYGIEQGPFGYDGAIYRGVAFAYHRDEVSAVLSDALDVGDPASEAAHEYESERSTFLAPFASQFEGERLEPVQSFDGRREPVRTSFRMSVDPANRGAWLRRVFDAADGVPHPQASLHYGPGQRARVYVDGVLAGIWHTAHRNIWRRWRESELALPAALCAGKSSLRIEIEPLSAEWNAFEYRLVSRLR